MRGQVYKEDSNFEHCALTDRERSGRRHRPAVGRFREHGVEIGLRLCVICRPTREEAVEAARSLLPQVYGSDIKGPGDLSRTAGD
jgi:alkanesulfonate monooxygenase SsuD/methylene tetrahydromethanopterin reductase-like flavin-dependent oxidoreductase (luciferase family)